MKLVKITQLVKQKVFLWKVTTDKGLRNTTPVGGTTLLRIAAEIKPCLNYVTMNTFTSEQ